MKKTKRRSGKKVEKRAIRQSHHSAGVNRVADAKRVAAVNLQIGGREHKEGWINLNMLCQLYVHPDVTEQHRWHIMRIMFGGQKNEHDFHKVGLSWVVLQDFLRQAGFFTSQRVDVFDMFDDTNKLEVLGNRISLNVETGKPAIATGKDFVSS